mgnify:CR=1 FL=1
MIRTLEKRSRSSGTIDDLGQVVRVAATGRGETALQQSPRHKDNLVGLQAYQNNTELVQYSKITYKVTTVRCG